MKNKKLLLSTVLISGLVLASSVLYFNNSSWYKPAKNKKIEAEGKEEDAIGAIKWLNDVRKNQITNSIDPMDVLAAREETNQLINERSASSLNLDWTELGPDNVGGRTRALLVDKRDATGNTLYAGSVGGGLFISHNGGTNWNVIPGFDQKPMLPLCGITQAANGDIYVGTGEDLYNGFGGGVGPGGLLGGGIYKSIDGVNFDLLPSTIPATSNSTGNSATNAFLGINNMASDPTNPNRIYAATRYGLQLTDDGGTTWTRATTLTGFSTGRATDVDVASDGTVLAAVNNKLLISSNGNANTFSVSPNTSGLPTTGVSRIEFAIAPSDPNYMYAVAAKSTNDLLQGVYQSIDKGVTWTRIGNGGSTQFEPFLSAFGQGTYDNAVFVFPNNKTRIIVGGVSMWTWQQTNPNVPGIGQWGYAASQGEFYAGGSPNPFYVHADVHTIKYNPFVPNVFYVGCDGGIFRGYDAGGGTIYYQPMNKGYNVTQFYSVAFQGDDPRNIGLIGGAQDNGTQYIGSIPGHPLSAVDLNGGDGTDCEISFLNPNVSFSTIDGGGLYRHSSKGGDGSDFYSKGIAGGIKNNTLNPSFVTPIALFETKNAINSPDSAQFFNLSGGQILATGNGINKHFIGTFNRPQVNAIYVPNGITITVGSSISITDDGLGSLVGSSINTSLPHTVNYTTGDFEFTLNSPPAIGILLNATFDVKYLAGSQISLNRPDYVDPLIFTANTNINPGDTVKVYDPFQVKMASGFTGCVYVTKGALDFSGTPKWFRIGNVSGTVEEMAWSSDGDILYVGTGSGNLYRFSNVSAITDSLNGDVRSSGCLVVPTQIGGFGGRFIAGISVDPTDNEKIAVSLGNYGNTSYVYYSTNAATCASSASLSNFTLKQGTGSTKLPAMPVYSVLIEKTNPNRVIVGTEHGIFSTIDITAANPVWTADNGVNTFIPSCPVFKVRQQRLPGSQVYNPGVIYVGTHGRGAWKSETFKQPSAVGIKEQNGSSKTNTESGILIYPNPVSTEATIAFSLGSSADVVITVYDLKGNLVKTIKAGKLNAGDQKVIVDAQEFAKGTYFVSVDGYTIHAHSKFVVIK